MRYVIARYNQNQRDMAYRIYISDVLRIMSNAEIPRFCDLLEGGSPGNDVEPGKPTEEIRNKLKGG